MSVNDDEAFEEFWRTHSQSVTRAAAAIAGDVQDGMEIAQEAFARAYQHWRKVSQMDRPDAWVHRVAANLAISKRRRRRPSLAGPELTTAAPATPDDELMKALRSLTPAQRAVVCLRYYLDWSVEEVADALGKAPGTVRALTHQGMERLRADLTKEPQDE